MLNVKQTGTFGFNYLNTYGWTLNTGNGVRHFKETVTYSTFDSSEVPTVVVSLNGFDADQHANVRVLVSPIDMEWRKFSIDVKTWGDTLLYGVVGTWIAYLPAPPSPE